MGGPAGEAAQGVESGKRYRRDRAVVTRVDGRLPTQPDRTTTRQCQTGADDDAHSDG